MIAYFAKHPTAANLLMIAIIILGITALPNLKRETFPEFQSKLAVVSIVYPGATPDEIASAICLPVEDAIDGVEQVEELQCEARENLATTTVTLIEGGDISKLVADIKNAVESIDSFPAQIETPTVEEQGRIEDVIHLAVQADINEVILKEYAESLKRKLKRLDGIDLVEIAGFSEHQLRLNLSLTQLRKYGLSALDVANALASQNVQLPSGTLKGKDKTVLIKFDQQQVNVDQLNELVISSSPAGGQIRLKDLGYVEDRFEHEEVQIRFNGQRAALLKIQKTREQDAIDIASKVSQFVEQEKSKLSPGIELTLTNNTSTIIDDRLKMLLTNGWQGILLVFAVMWLFFSWRYAFWVSMGLPVSFLGTLFLMSIFGLSINMISMVAMLMAIGIIMDDAIVIAESIASKVEKGANVNEGAIEGVKQVLPGVISSFLTTCAIFGGMAFIQGDIGQVLKVVPIVLLLTLSVSLIEAFLILPNHLIHSLRKHPIEQKPVGFKLPFQTKFDAFRQTKLVWAVEKVVTYRYAFVGSLLAVFFVSLALASGGVLKFKAFPNTEGDILEARLILPPGTPFEDTQNIVERISTAALTINSELSPLQPKQQDLIKNLTVEFNTNRDAFESGEHLATIRMELLTVEQRNTSIYEVKRYWQDALNKIPSVVSLAVKEPALGPAGRAVEIRLQDDSIENLLNIAKKVQDQLHQYPGVNNILLDTRPGKEELTLSLLPGALSLGANGNMIASQVSAAFNGQKVDDVQRGNEQIELEVRLQSMDKLDVEQLQNFPIILQNGAEIPLSSLVAFNSQRGVSRINRIDGVQTLTIIGDVDPEVANTSEVLNDLQTTLLDDLLSQNPNLEISFYGEAKEGGETSKSIATKFLMGLVGIFIILSFQFKSYFEPIMVMTAIPLALIGVFAGHLLLGFELTMPSIVGFISLAGIVVNDSILLVAFIKLHMAEGQDAHIAAVNAAKERFRAVLITSATTIAGTFPLLLETSTQAQVLQPLVVSLIFGILASTCLILFLIPALYVILQDFGLASEHHMPEVQS